MIPKSEKNIIPEKCRCGGFVAPESAKPFYTHQVIELPQIDMDVEHFILRGLKNYKYSQFYHSPNF
jgi:transposase